MVVGVFCRGIFPRWPTLIISTVICLRAFTQCGYYVKLAIVMGF